MTITNVRPGTRIKVASRGVTPTELTTALSAKQDQSDLLDQIAAFEGASTTGVFYQSDADTISRLAVGNEGPDRILDRQSADERYALLSDFNAEVAAREAEDIPVDDIMSLAYGRPGDAPAYFVSTPPGTLVFNADGKALRIAGADTIVKATPFFALEPSRMWRIRLAGLRITNSDDPELDAVELACLFYDYQRHALLPPDDEERMESIAPTVAEGRFTLQTTVGFGGGSGIIAPADARYFRIFVEVYGDTPVTDIEVLEALDITDAMDLITGSAAMAIPIQLLDDETLAGNGEWQTWPGGEAYIDLEGTPDGAEFNLERQSPSGTAVVVDAAQAVDGVYNAAIGVIPAGLVRAVLSTVGASTSLTAYITRVET